MSWTHTRTTGRPSVVPLLVAMLSCWLWGAAPQPVQGVQGERLTLSGRILPDDGFAHLEVQALPSLHQRGQEQWAQRPSRSPLQRFKTRQSGHFEIELPPGFWRLTVQRDGFLPMVFDLEPLLTHRTLPDLVLTPARRCSLRLVDDRGAVSGVMEATAYGWSRRWRAWSRRGWWPMERPLRRDHEGRFSVPWDGAEKLRVSGWSDDVLWHQVVTCDSESIVDVTPTGGWATTRLVDPLGAPMAGVWGFFRWPLRAFGRSDADGLLRVPDDPAVAEVWLADESGFYGSPELPDAPRPAVAGRQRNWTLPTTVSVRGRLSDVLSTAPVTDGWVWSAADPRHRVRSDAQGLFRLRVARGSDHQLRFAAAGYSPLDGPIAEEVQDGLLDVRLTPMRNVQGRVLDLGSQPLAGVELVMEYWRGPDDSGDQLNRARDLVVFSDASVPNTRWQAMTDRDGRFELQGLDASQVYRLSARKEGFRHRPLQLDLVGLGDGPLEIVMTGARRARGHVLDEAERPLAGAHVTLVTAEQEIQIGWQEPTQGATTTSGEDGEFVFDNPPSGTFYLTARAPGFPELIVPGVELSPLAEDIPLGDLILAPGQRLYGWVESDGEPVPGAQLSVRRRDGDRLLVQRQESVWFASTRSDASGAFSLEGLPQDTGLTLLVVADGWLPEQLELRLTDAPRRLEIDLRRGGFVRGIVERPDGQPAAGAGVMAWSGDFSHDRAGLSRGQSWARTDAEGRFELGRMEPGEYRLFAGSLGGISTPRALTVVSDTQQEVRLRLEPWGSLRGRVVDADEGPVEGALIRLNPLDPLAAHRPIREVVNHTKSDVNGDFRLLKLIPGTYRVLLEHADHERRTLEVEIVRGATDVRWQAGERLPTEGLRSVTGWTMDSQGTPCRGATVSLLGRQGLIYAKSGPDGAFEVQAQAGVYRLSAEHSSCGHHGGLEIDVQDSDRSGVLLQLSSDVVLRGRVEGLDLAELSQLQVVAMSGLQRRYGTFDHQGNYRVEGLAPGHWWVQAALLNPRRMTRRDLNVEEGRQEVHLDLSFPTGHTVSGVAAAPTGPLADGVVTLRCSSGFEARTTSGGQGEFAFEGVPDGSCHLAIQDPRSRAGFERQVDVVQDLDLWCDVTSPEAP